MWKNLVFVLIVLSGCSSPPTATVEGQKSQTSPASAGDVKACLEAQGCTIDTTGCNDALYQGKGLCVSNQWGGALPAGCQWVTSTWYVCPGNSNLELPEFACVETFYAPYLCPPAAKTACAATAPCVLVWNP